MIEQFITKLKIDKVDFKSIRYILDVGSRDGLQSIELKGHFTNAKVLAIEGNADMMPTLRKNVLAHSDIKPIEAVINDYVGESIFYRIDKEKTITPHLDGNPGASSLFIADESYQLEKYHQIPVPVKCYTLDYICDEEGVDSVDLIWMDLQGAVIKALSGFLNRLPHLKYIWVEVTHSTIYKKQPLFQEFNHFMHTNGFERITKINPNTYFEDVLYRRINLKKSTPDDIVISQSWGGLGDNLQYSSLPRLYSSLGKKVFLSRDNASRNYEIEDVVWADNPFIEGISCEPSNAGEILTSLNDLNFSFMNRIEKSHGFLPTNESPEIFDTPKLLNELGNITLMDLSSSGIGGGNKTGYSEFLSWTIQNHQISLDSIHNIRFTHYDSNNIAIDGFHFIDCHSLRELIQFLYSCKSFITVHSGAHALAVAVKNLPGSNLQNIYCCIPKEQFNLKIHTYNSVEYYVN